MDEIQITIKKENDIVAGDDSGYTYGLLMAIDYLSRKKERWGFEYTTRLFTRDRPERLANGEKETDFWEIADLRMVFVSAPDADGLSYRVGLGFQSAGDDRQPLGARSFQNPFHELIGNDPENHVFGSTRENALTVQGGFSWQHVSEDRGWYCRFEGVLDLNTHIERSSVAVSADMGLTLVRGEDDMPVLEWISEFWCQSYLEGSQYVGVGSGLRYTPTPGVTLELGAGIPFREPKGIWKYPDQDIVGRLSLELRPGLFNDPRAKYRNFWKN